MIALLTRSASRRPGDIWTRAIAYGFLGAVLIGLSAHAIVQDGGNALRVVSCIVVAGSVLTGIELRSSIAVAFGLVGLSLIWALSQTTESATGAVLVGALVTIAASTASWLGEDSARLAGAGRVRLITRTATMLCASSALGLAALRLLERPAAGRTVIVLGVAALLGVLALFTKLGDEDR